MNSRKSLQLRTMIILLGVAGLLLFAGFVWPSQYQYRTMNLGMLGPQEIREARFTGETQVCGAGVWQKIEISGDRVTIPGGIHIMVGGGQPCPRASWIATAAIVCVAAIELVLVYLLLVERKQQESQHEGKPENRAAQ
jgi:hypothetical protein